MRVYRILAYVSPLLCLSQCVPALGATASKSRPRQRSVLTIEQFVRRLSNEGQPMRFPPVIAKLVELDPNAEHRTLSVGPGETTDGRARDASVVLVSVKPEAKPEPAKLSWSLSLEEDGRREVYRYRSALDGTLEKAVRLDGRLDEAGKPIRGSGSTTSLNVESKEVREQFRDRILDFWLKDKYRAKSGRKP